MNSKVLLAVGAIALAAIAGVTAYALWPEPIPRFQVANETGQPVAFEELFDDKDYLLLVFLVPNCQVSKFASGIVNEQHARFSDRMAFVGLVFGNHAAAQQYAKSEGLAFPTYGLRDAPDPFAVQELVKVVGTSHGLGSAVFGGTIVVVKKNGDIVFQLEKENVRDLPKRLGSAGS